MPALRSTGRSMRGPGYVRRGCRQKFDPPSPLFASSRCPPGGLTRLGISYLPPYENLRRRRPPDAACSRMLGWLYPPYSFGCSRIRAQWEDLGILVPCHLTNCEDLS